MWSVLVLVDNQNGCRCDQGKDDKVVPAGETHSEHISYSPQLAHAAHKDGSRAESRRQVASYTDSTSLPHPTMTGRKAVIGRELCMMVKVSRNLQETGNQKGKIKNASKRGSTSRHKSVGDPRR